MTLDIVDIHLDSLALVGDEDLVHAVLPRRELTLPLPRVKLHLHGAGRARHLGLHLHSKYF